jgi:hypothetical protein
MSEEYEKELKTLLFEVNYSKFGLSVYSFNHLTPDEAS